VGVLVCTLYVLSLHIPEVMIDWWINNCLAIIMQRASCIQTISDVGK
jgi:hypothetical protein